MYNCTFFSFFIPNFVGEKMSYGTKKLKLLMPAKPQYLKISNYFALANGVTEI